MLPKKETKEMYKSFVCLKIRLSFFSSLELRETPSRSGNAFCKKCESYWLEYKVSRPYTIGSYDKYNTIKVNTIGMHYFDVWNTAKNIKERYDAIIG